MASINDRALKLLGAGASPEQTALALGVTASAISQLVSDAQFSAKVAELRFQNLSRANDIDAAYDSMETALQKKLADLIPFMIKPGEILGAIRIINAAKRRGSSQVSDLTNQAQVVILNLPQQIHHTFVVNETNQIIKAGIAGQEEDMITIQSGSMKKLLALAHSPHSSHSPDSRKESNDVQDSSASVS